MDKFIHRENLALFRKRLADRGLTDDQRQAILRLLTEEHAKSSGDPAHTLFQARPPCPSAVENIHSHERSERIVDPYQGTLGSFSVIQASRNQER
jgi:hypothetical protein